MVYLKLKPLLKWLGVKTKLVTFSFVPCIDTYFAEYPFKWVCNSVSFLYPLYSAFNNSFRTGLFSYIRYCNILFPMYSKPTFVSIIIKNLPG